MDQRTDHEADHERVVQCQSEITIECSAEAAADHQKGSENNSDGNFKCYKHRKVSVVCLSKKRNCN